MDRDVLMELKASKDYERKNARVVLDEVRTQRVERMRLVTGELRAVRRSRVAAERHGIVVELVSIRHHTPQLLIPTS